MILLSTHAPVHIVGLPHEISIQFNNDSLAVQDYCFIRGDYMSIVERSQVINDIAVGILQKVVFQKKLKRKYTVISGGSSLSGRGIIYPFVGRHDDGLD
jgi:hypothetical protein